MDPVPLWSSQPLMGARRRRIEGADEERGNGPTKTWRLVERTKKTWAPEVGRRRRRRPGCRARKGGESARAQGRMGEVKAARRDGGCTGVFGRVKGNSTSEQVC